MRRAVALLGTILITATLLVGTAGSAHAVVPCSTAGCITANDDNYTTTFDTKLTVDAAHGVLANDLGPVMQADGGPTTVDVANTLADGFGANGHLLSWNGADVAIHADGSFVYTPDPTNPFSGLDNFSYDIKDAQGDTDYATAYIQVNPIVTDDIYYTHKDEMLTVGAPGVFANDQGLDPDTITLDPTSTHGGSIDDNGEGAFDYTPPAGFEGIDTFTYLAWDLDGDNFYEATVTVDVDSTPPALTMSQPAPVTLATKVAAQWSATDSSGIAFYDVQRTGAPSAGTFGAWQNWRSPTTATEATLATLYGNTYCFRVRAIDRAGNTSAWKQRCTAVPLRATGLTYAAGWTPQTSSTYFSGVASRTIKLGARASRTNIQAQHMWLVATKCTSCGTLQARWNNAVIANVNLHGSTTLHHQLIPIAAFPSVRSGTITLTVTSPNGRPVVVEGLAVLRA